MGADFETGLVTAAIAAMARAYAPYSRFPVGAAIRDETGAQHAAVAARHRDFGNPRSSRHHHGGDGACLGAVADRIGGILYIGAGMNTVCLVKDRGANREFGIGCIGPFHGLDGGGHEAFFILHGRLSAIP